MKYRTTFTILAFLLSGCTQSADTDAQQKNTSALTDSEIAQIDKLFSQYNSNSPGASIGIVQDGKLIFTKAYGQANLEYGIPITSGTMFNIGSVSKQFTAYAIFLLEAEGKISLDDDIRDYIPELPDYGSVITIRQLCNHTSGIRSHLMLLAIAGWRADDAIARAQILNLLVNQTALDFAPGSKFSYSNSGYFLLAEIISRASEQPFSEYTQDRIFSPLGMKNSYVYDDASVVLPNRAASYYVSKGKPYNLPLNTSYAGSTGVYSTVPDMARWVSNFENPIAGDAKLIARFNETALLKSGAPAILTIIDGETIYGASGQFKRNYRGTPLYNHTGGDAGYRAYLARFPEKQTSIITLSNAFYFQHLKTGLAMADIVMEGELEIRPDIPAQETSGGQSSEQSKDQVKPENTLGLVGRYQSQEMSTFYDVKLADGELILYHARLGKIPLKHISGDSYSARIEYPFTVEFIRDATGQASAIMFSNYRIHGVRFERVKAS